MVTWLDLLQLSDSHFAKLDVGLVNLLCAVDLPKAERLNIDSYLKILDSWAQSVQQYTENLLPRFRRTPEKYANSEAYFRCLCLITVLQRDLGVRSTDKLNVPDPDVSDSRDWFLHGVLQGLPGTCSSLPFLYAAVGHRLGYPLQIIPRPSHLFLRWSDGTGQQFNIESTARGCFTPPDEFYLTWPFPTTPTEWTGTYFFKPLSRREQLSACLTPRAYCLASSGQFRESVLTAARAHELAPHHRPHLYTLKRLMYFWARQLQEVIPPPFPKLTIRKPLPQFPSLPVDIEREIIHLAVLEGLSQTPNIQKAYRRPVVRSPLTHLPIGLPDRVVVDCARMSLRDALATLNPARKP